MKPITYPFSFPLCDLLICEFDGISNAPHLDAAGVVPRYSTNGPYLVGSRPSTLPRPVNRIRSVAAFIYQKVVRRQPIPYQVDPVGHPGILGCYIREHLECGHQQEVFPAADDLVARKRSCHECLREFVKANVKKPVQSAAREVKAKAASGYGYWPVAFASLLVVGVALWIHSLKATIYAYSADALPPNPKVSFRVLKQFNAYDFELQRVVNGVPQKPESWHGCHDQKPRFEIGFTLAAFSFEDRGSCADIAVVPRPAYRILKDENDWPIIPANCFNPGVEIPVVCNGEPQF